MRFEGAKVEISWSSVLWSLALAKKVLNTRINVYVFLESNRSDLTVFTHWPVYIVRCVSGKRITSPSYFRGLSA